MKPSISQKRVIKRITSLISSWSNTKNIDIYTLESDIDEVCNHMIRLYKIDKEQISQIKDSVTKLLWDIRAIK